MILSRFDYAPKNYVTSSTCVPPVIHPRSFHFSHRKGVCGWVSISSHTLLYKRDGATTSKYSSWGICENSSLLIIFLWIIENHNSVENIKWSISGCTKWPVVIGLCGWTRSFIRQPRELKEMWFNVNVSTMKIHNKYHGCIEFICIHSCMHACKLY